MFHKRGYHSKKGDGVSKKGDVDAKGVYGVRERVYEMMEREMEFKRWRRSCKKGYVVGKWVRCWKRGTEVDKTI